MSRSQQALLLAAGIVFAAYIALRFSGIISVIDLRDFTTYYAAAKAFVAGDDPYDLSVLSAYAGKEHRYAFFYPKYSLVFFAPFTVFEYQTSAILFVVLKALALLVLVYVWMKFFLPDVFSALLLCLFLVTAYHETVLRDFVVGNISVFEQLLLWVAFLNFLRGRLRWFYPLVIASALLKPMTGVFLLIPFAFQRDRTTILAGMASVGFLAVYYLGSYAGQSELIARMSNLQWEGSYLNPTMFALIKDILTSFGVESQRLIPYSSMVFSVYAFFLCLGTFLIFKKADKWRNRGVFLLVVIFLYVLLMPRFKDYSYILLLVPSIFVIRDMVRYPALKWLAVVAICVHVTAYQSLFTAGFLLLLLMGGLSNVPSSYSLLKPHVPNTAVQ